MSRTLGVVIAVGVAVLLASGCAQKRTKTAKSAGEAGLQKVYFDFDKSNIKPEYESALQGNARWMQEHSSTNVSIEGNCDERGSNEYNIALGDRRAKSAQSYLKNLGVSPSRMGTVSYGEEKPVCNGHDENCWWQNRRDDFVTK